MMVSNSIQLVKTFTIELNENGHHNSLCKTIGIQFIDILGCMYENRYHRWVGFCW
jgi:hypothetical protein